MKKHHTKRIGTFSKIVWGAIFVIIISTALYLYLLIKQSKQDHPDPLLEQQINSISAISPASPSEQRAAALHLVKIHDADPTIGILLKYATTDNFTGQVLYDDLEAYLQTDVAEMLAKANQYLIKIRPDLRLLVYDAARPLNVQRTMWERVKDTPYKNYVANPEKTGLHNYGAAVDLTIADTAWNPLDMGTDFDFFGKAAGINDEEELIKQGILTTKQVENRKLLHEVMHHARFRSVSGEWWHFNACSLEEAKKRYPLIENL